LLGFAIEVQDSGNEAANLLLLKNINDYKDVENSYY